MIIGRGFTVTAVVAVEVHPLALVTVTVYVPEFAVVAAIILAKRVLASAVAIVGLIAAITPLASAAGC